MHSYKLLLQNTLLHGTPADSRAGAVLRSSHLFWTHDLRLGFPLLTARKMFTKGIIGELVCFVKGYTDISEYTKRGCNFWTANLEDMNRRNGTPDNTDLGPIYAKQLRNFNGVDQLRKVLNNARDDSTSRRLLVNYWNPAEMDKTALPCCHYAWQISIVDNKYLDLIFHMRSVDLALGLPTDIAHYGLLAHLLANELFLTPRQLSCSLADAHIYGNNLPGVTEYLEAPDKPLPTLTVTLPPGAFSECAEVDSFVFENYNPGPAINMGKMAV